MATKLTLTSLSKVDATVTDELNGNFTAIEDEFDKVVYRDGTSPNTLTDTLDANSQRIVNLPVPTSSTEPLRKGDQFTSTEAQSYAEDAETAKDAAEAALNEFNEKYYGHSSVDPTETPSGGSLSTGDLYFNTSFNVLKVYNGSSWVVSANQFFPNVDSNVTATDTELNILDGVTASTAELNTLDGVTATAAELNNADESATAGGGFLKGPTSSTDPELAFDTWRTPNATRPVRVLLDVGATTDGTTSGWITLQIDESGGTSADYSFNLIFASPAFTDSPAEVVASTFFTVPAGGSYRINNFSDPNSTNAIYTHREWVE